jgi:PAS domain S-box-containing protein
MIDSRPLEDPADIERSQHSHQHSSRRWVLLSIALMMLGMALAEHLLAPPGKSLSHIALSMGGIALIAYLLVRSDHRQWASPLVVMGVLVLTAWAVVSQGSVRSASAFAFLFAVVLAGTYLNLRALLATTVAGVLLLAGLTWAEVAGHLPPAGTQVDLRYWLMGSVIMVLIGAQLYHTRKATEEVYLRHLAQVEDRLRLEHERDRSQRRFQRIFQLNPTALLVQAASSRAVLEVNPAFERRFGHPAAQVVGQPADRLWADPAQWQAHCQVLFEHGRTDWQPARWLGADGQPQDVLVCSELNEDSAGLLILTSVVDSPVAPGAGLVSRSTTS